MSPTSRSSVAKEKVLRTACDSLSDDLAAAGFQHNLPTRLNARFANAFYLRTVRAITRFWDERFGELVAYKEQFQDCDVPFRWPKNRQLGIWVVAQRQAKKLGQLDDRQIKLLDSIGFDWQPQATWDETFAKLVAFQNRFGHCNVDQRWEEDPHLGRWVLKQRIRYNSGLLEKDRKAKLNSIGFTWHTGGTSWNDTLEQLIEYKSKHGHFEVPAKENKKLSRWVFYQRYLKAKDRLKPDKIERLEKLSFPWEAQAIENEENAKEPAANKADLYWERMFGELLKFYKAEGHCNVPSRWKENPKLANWVAVQRRIRQRQLRPRTPKRIRRLDEIGFVWNHQRNKRSWDEMYAALVGYKTKHHDCNVPTPWNEDLQLGWWVRNQRAAKRAGKYPVNKSRG